MSKPLNIPTDILKFLLAVVVGGVCSIGVLYGLSVNNLFMIIGLIIVSFAAGLFLQKEAAGSVAFFGFVLGAWQFGMVSSYGDMIWSIVFSFILLAIVTLREFLKNDDMTVISFFRKLNK